MPIYIILTKLSTDSFEDPRDFKKIADKVSSTIKKQCPQVKWRASYATLGRFDVVDVVETDDEEQLERAVMIIRGYGRASTETLPATPWQEFLRRL